MKRFDKAIRFQQNIKKLQHLVTLTAVKDLRLPHINRQIGDIVKQCETVQSANAPDIYHPSTVL